MRDIIEKFKNRQAHHYHLYFDDVVVVFLEAEEFEYILKSCVKTINRGYVDLKKIKSAYIEIDNQDFLLIKDGSKSQMPSEQDKPQKEIS